MHMKQMLAGSCKFCGRKITKAILEQKRKAKADNGRKSLAKARANGNAHKMHRPKIRNDEQIRELRKRGLSIRAIAKEIGLSTTAVQRGLGLP